MEAEIHSQNSVCIRITWRTVIQQIFGSHSGFLFSRSGEELKNLHF